MNVLNKMVKYGHEQVTMYSDPETGLRGIIAIHDTTLGPSCGGTRMWPYPSEADALADALRLSQAMTYKSAAAGLNLGGGKGVIIGDPRTDKTEGLLRAWGRFVDTLGGRYLTTTDVGTTGRDLESIRQETQHVVGLDTTLGGSGDTSIMTAWASTWACAPVRPRLGRRFAARTQDRHARIRQGGLPYRRAPAGRRRADLCHGHQRGRAGPSPSDGRQGGRPG